MKQDKRSEKERFHGKRQEHFIHHGGFHELTYLWNLTVSRIWVILTVLLLVLALAIGYLFLAQRLYASTAVVQVERHDQSEIKTSSNFRDPISEQEELNTVTEKLQSPPLLALVLVQAGCIPTNSAESLLPIFLKTDNLSGGADNSKWIPPGSGKLNTNQEGKHANATLQYIQDFKSHISVKLRRNTRLIDISVSNPDPAKAAMLANLIVENYLNFDFRIKSTMNRIQNDFFKSEYNHLAEKLEQSEQALHDYCQTNGSVEFADLNAPKTDDEITQIQKQLTQSRSDSTRLKSSYEESLKMGTNVDELLAYNQIATDPQVQILQTAIAQQQAAFVQIKDQFREKNPKYYLAKQTLAGLQEQMAHTVLEIRHRIQESLRLPYENAFSTCKGLETDLGKAQIRKLELNQKGIRYSMLSRQMEADRVMYDAIYQRVNEISVNARLAPFTISVVQTAYPSSTPSSPKMMFVLAVAILGSLGLGIGLAFILETLNTGLLTVDDAEDYLQQPVLSAIPKLDFEKGKSPVRLVETCFSPDSEQAEYFRTLRTSLLLNEADKKLRSLLVASSYPGEGKTFVSCNMAASLARQGFRTLVLDFDLRRPRLEEFFNGVNVRLPGLTDLMLQQKKLADVVQKYPGFPKLEWIPAGAPVINPSELLLRDTFRTILEQALNEYDRVIIDTPPIHPVKDALIVSGCVDGVILLVHAGKTPRRAVASTVRWLEEAGAPLLGVVLNQQPRRRNGYGYSHYNYYYGYGSTDNNPS